MFFSNKYSHNLFSLWVVFALSFSFTVLFWQPSTGAGLNLLDIFITVPSLLFLLPIILIRGQWKKNQIVAAAPLLAYLTFALVSMLWGEDPDYSKGFRAAAQVLGLAVFFIYLYTMNKEKLLIRGLFSACCVTAVICLWHLISVYGVLSVPLGTVLYQGVSITELSNLGVTPVNTMLATLLVAPQAALLMGLLIREKDIKVRFFGFVFMAIFLCYLLMLERRTGQVVILSVLFLCVFMYRNWYWYFTFLAFTIIGLFVFWSSPELIISRGYSWRPEIWISTFASVLEEPIFGHGLSNNVVPVVVLNNEGDILGIFRHPHNMALSVSYFLGLTGFLLWLSLWLPGFLKKLIKADAYKDNAYIILPLAAGNVALIFDGEAALSPWHFYWFCFWVPVLLLLGSQIKELHEKESELVFVAKCEEVTE